MTIAVANGIMKGYGNANDVENEIAASRRAFGRNYPNAGYGAMFSYWLDNPRAGPYNSYGNGSAMRVSPIAWAFDTLEDVEKYAEISARVTHNHPEGIKGAQATAGSIFMARTGHSKEDIRKYVEGKYGYDLGRTLDEIRPSYRHVESCQETVPEAITAFLEGKNYEDAVRKAVSLGGDSDTLTAITGSIAQGFYGIPNSFIGEAASRIDERLWNHVIEWHEWLFERDLVSEILLKSIRNAKK
jgi:ADP-ribosylglycohydrolase